MDDDCQRIHGLGVDQDRHLHKVALLVVLDIVVEAGIALGDRLQPVIEIKHHFIERQAIDRHGAAAHIGQVLLDAAAVLTQLQHGAEILIGDQDGGLDPRLLDVVDLHRVRHVGGIVQLHHRAVGHVHVIDHARRGGDEVDVELTLQPFADDLQMQQAKETAAEAEAQRR